MDIYKNNEELKLKKRIGLTKEVFMLVRKKKKELKEKKIRISMAKIVCNLIIKHIDEI